MEEKVLPIKDSNVLKQVQECLLHDFKAGRRNYTIFQVGKATLLRVSDVLALKSSDVFDEQGNVKLTAWIHDKKTDKTNRLYLKPVEGDLAIYRQWCNQHDLNSAWLFPSITRPERHITGSQYYKVMHHVGDWLGLDYLGTHTMRKTGAYRVYTQTNYNIGLVMDLLNHSSQSETLKYLGLDQETKESVLDKINFD